MDKEKQTFYRGHRWVGKCTPGWVKMGSDHWYVLTRDFKLRMERKPFAGTFCTAATRRALRPGETVPAIVRQREWPSMKRVPKADQAQVKHLAAMETNMMKEHMAVLEHLALLQYGDGSPRVPGRLFVSVMGAVWSVILKDPDSTQQLKVAGVTWDDAMDALQVHLASEQAPWEPDTWEQQKRSGKGKK